ncbi:YjgP/YjgQ family permease [Candidatus Poribacteria bacterium]|jgi:LPS export ABC transporter permease LptG|nr:YjgP/YjgQ family permease [Candidatus Poribacteria bacterium]MBT5536250.1 YjgP/YjgQ family permease [Candidatus Poribacteria bacterium]MBT7099319.1 YjgP/YjgQ family permease [Candidatus Poribacteria bacterium]MBT7808951.1 YjgP/YjgQ family permease [Candidatus Poribacteria bacterium]
MIADLLLYVILPCVLLGLAVAYAPMSIFDRYVLRKFSTLFLAAFSFEVALILTIRLSDRELGNMFLDPNASVMAAFKLFALHAPARVMEVVPYAGILGAFLTMGSLLRANEITAFRASGTNLLRLVTPIAIFTFACCVIALVFTDRIVAPAAHAAAQMGQTRKVESDQHIVYRESGGALCFIAQLNVATGSAYKLTFYEMSGGELRNEIYARTAGWTDASWELKGGWQRRYDTDGGSSLEAFTLLHRPLDTDPATLIAAASKPEEMTFAELREVIAFKRRAGFPVRREIVRFHHNIAYSFALLVGVLLAVPLSLQFGRFALAAGFPATMLISFVYWGLAIATFEAMGENGRIPPSAAAWIGNVVFACVAALLLRAVKR